MIIQTIDKVVVGIIVIMSINQRSLYSTFAWYYEASLKSSHTLWMIIDP